MSRRSTATVRVQPVANVSSDTGTVRVHAETMAIETERRLQVLDITDRVMAIVRAWPVREGVVSLFSLHTTCTVFVNEYQKALVADYETFLESVVDSAAPWRHNDPALSDCGRRNTDAHLRALLLGHSLTLQVSGGEVVLGKWQRVLFAELDGPQTRTLRLSVMGVA